MIIIFKQRSHYPSFDIVGKTLDGTTILLGEGTDNAASLHTQNGIFTLIKSSTDHSNKSKKCNIITNGKVTGEIEPHFIHGTGLFSKSHGFWYQTILINDILYEMYDIGFGRDQHYYCLLCKGTTVAMAHVSDSIVNFMRAPYPVSATSPLALTAIFLGILQKEAMQPDNKKEKPRIGNDVFITRNKALNAKFDRSFWETMRQELDTQKTGKESDHVSQNR